MAEGVILSDTQKKLFAELLASASDISEHVSKQEAKYDAFKSLEGSEKVVSELKRVLPLSFRGQCIVSVDSSNLKDIVVGVGKFVSQSEMVPVFVLMNYNYKTLQNALKEEGFTGNYFVIDSVSKSIAQVSDSTNVFFIDSLRNLSQIQIKIINLIEANSKAAFIFDSLSVLQLYHEEEIVFKFIYSLTKILHKNSSNGFYISAKKTLSSKLSQFFDESIEIKKFL